MSFILEALKGWIRAFLRMIGLFSPPKSDITVVVKVNSGERVSIEGEGLQLIGEIADHVGKTIHLQPDQELRFILAGKELKPSTTLKDCDLGDKSILHAVRVKVRKGSKLLNNLNEEAEEGSQPLSETLLDLQLSPEERSSVSESERSKVKAHFYVWCSTCRKMCEGKLRVICDNCVTGAFTVHSDPQSWDHVLKPKQITGECLAEPSCSKVHHDAGPSYAEFYFKCAEHSSEGQKDPAVPLYLIKPNIRNIPCLACSETSDIVLVFPCNSGHVTCLECYRLYCTSRLHDRQFFFHAQIGYTLPCPVGCENSYIEEVHHFKLMSEAQYNQYQRFGAEEFVLQSGGVLCPQPDCGMGILIDPGCVKVTCTNGCGYVFCVKCLQGYHIGECGDPDEVSNQSGETCQYNVDPSRVNQAQWEAASKVTIRVTSKPCPACRTPTERDGGCMHMICTRAGCKYEWCWVCQTHWTRECMAAHWFG